MKQPKVFFLIIITLLPLIFASCIAGRTQLAKGWSGTAFQDGIIYVGAVDGRVVAINSSTQSQQWSYSIDPPATIYTTPLVNDDLVYIGTYNGQVLALNRLARNQNLTFPQKGDGEWEWDCPIDSVKSNAIVADLAVSEDALYVASSNGRVYCLDKETGDENWKREDIPVLAEKLWTSPVVQDDALYVGTFDGCIYALSLETGELLDWSFESEAGFASAPVIDEDVIYVGSFDRHLYAVEIGSDEPMWKFPQEKPAGNWFWATPIVNEGIVYAGCLDGKLYAVESETGEEIWQFDAQKPIVSSPVLVDNLLVVANEVGYVYVINPETGVGERIENPENSDKPSINDQIRASLCAHEGLVYIRDENNQLYIVDIEQMNVSQPIPLTNEE